MKNAFKLHNKETEEIHLFFAKSGERYAGSELSEERKRGKWYRKMKKLVSDLRGEKKNMDMKNIGVKLIFSFF